MGQLAPHFAQCARPTERQRLPPTFLLNYPAQNRPLPQPLGIASASHSRFVLLLLLEGMRSRTPASVAGDGNSIAGNSAGPPDLACFVRAMTPTSTLIRTVTCDAKANSMPV